MKAKQKGYTIVEVMIFLAISSALFLVSIVGMRDQLNRTRFRQNMVTVQNIVTEIMDTVDKGYTFSEGAKTCTANGNVMTIINGPAQNNSNCLFYGRDIDVCASTTQFTINTYLANNKAIVQPGAYPPVNVPSLSIVKPFPTGTIFIPTLATAPNPTNSNTRCHLASLYQNSNENYQKVPRFQGDKQLGGTNPNWTSLDDKLPLRWCFQDGTNTRLKASLLITQVNISLNMGDDQC